jgi:hypothetical protein
VELPAIDQNLASREAQGRQDSNLQPPVLELDGATFCLLALALLGFLGIAQFGGKSTDGDTARDTVS